jgi:hypothetical protein
MILTHMFLEFFFGGPADVHPGTAHLGTAEGFLVPVRVLYEAFFVREAFVEVVACVTGASVPFVAVVLLEGSLCGVIKGRVWS